MAINLLIVESPAKAKTLKKYLGNDFEVLASYGHVRDLVTKSGAVDTENGIAMNYEIIARNSKHMDAIAKAAALADNILLAPDPDREGEAIAWHIAELLKAKLLTLFERSDRGGGLRSVHAVNPVSIRPAAAKLELKVDQRLLHLPNSLVRRGVVISDRHSCSILEASL